MSFILSPMFPDLRLPLPFNRLPMSRSQTLILFLHLYVSSSLPTCYITYVNYCDFTCNFSPIYQLKYNTYKIVCFLHCRVLLDLVKHTPCHNKKRKEKRSNFTRNDSYLVENVLSKPNKRNILWGCRVTIDND